jgi:hypothetical protein
MLHRSISQSLFSALHKRQPVVLDVTQAWQGKKRLAKKKEIHIWNIHLEPKHSSWEKRKKQDSRSCQRDKGNGEERSVLRNLDLSPLVEDGLKGCLGEIRMGRNAVWVRALIVGAWADVSRAFSEARETMVRSYSEIPPWEVTRESIRSAELGMRGSLRTEREGLKSRVEIICRLTITKEAEQRDKK